MSIKLNLNPSAKTLKQFGLIVIFATLILAALLYFVKGLALKWCFLILLFGFFVFLSSIMLLKITAKIYLGLTLLTYSIGLVVNFIILAVLYYLVITPIGLFFHLIGRDPLNRKFDSTRQSYWVDHRPVTKMKQYFQHF